MKYFSFSENNSGGSWWLTGENYRDLLATGRWGLERSDLEDFYAGKKQKFVDQEFLLRHSLVGRFESYQAAQASFESVTGQDLDAAGCECCGSPFHLYEDVTVQDVVFPGDALLALEEFNSRKANK